MGVKQLLKRADKSILILVVIYLIVTPFLLTPWIHSNDAVGYYSYLRSVAIDRDLDLSNEYGHYQEIFPDINIEYSQTGKVINRYMVGTAILWSPFFIAGDIVTKISGLFGGDTPQDGYSFFYVWGIAFGSSLYALFGLIILLKLLRKFFSRFASFITVISILFATPLVFYMWLQPSVSHAISFFSVTAFVAYWYHTKENRTKTKWLLLGLLAGLMTIIRHQNGIFMIIPLMESVKNYYTNRKDISKMLVILKKNLVFLIGVVLSISPQLIVFKILTGSFFSAFSSAQAGKQLNLLPIHFFKVLFGTHGLLSWTPLFIFSLIGLYFLYKKEKELVIYFTTAFLLQLYLLSSWAGWFGGAAFGQRKFTSSLFIFAFGLAAMIEFLRNKKIKKWIISVCAAALITWNFGLLIQFGSRMIPAGCCVSMKEIIYNNFFEVPKKIISILKTFIFERGKFLKP